MRPKKPFRRLWLLPPSSSSSDTSRITGPPERERDAKRELDLETKNNNIAHTFISPI